MSCRDLKEELTCPICMELFRQPRRLPCGHSYCYICLKSMLDRCTAQQELYVSRPLVCPECREEVNVDDGRGVEVIPPDFKLSKLVDLFRFMKKNDGSDSSDDELQPYRPAVTCSVKDDPPGDISSSASASSVVGTAGPLVDGQPLPNIVIAGPVVATQTVPTGGSTSAYTVATQAALTQISSDAVLIPDSTVATSATATHTPVSTDAALTTGSTIVLSASPTLVSTAAHTVATPAGLTNTPSIDLSQYIDVLGDSDLLSSSWPSISGPSHSEPPTITTAGTLDHLGSHTASDTRGATVMHQMGHGTNPNNLLSSNIVSRPTRPSHPLTENVQARSGENQPQDIDTEYLLDSFHRICEDDLNPDSHAQLDHMEEGEASNYLHHSLQTTNLLEDACSSSRILPALSNESDNAVRIPTKSKSKETPARSGSTEHSAFESQQNVRVTGVVSRTVANDTSSHSPPSHSNAKPDRGPAGKSKDWLMTRFLRSVILSDSSSSDDSEGDADDEIGNTAVRPAEEINAASLKYSPGTDLNLNLTTQPAPGNNTSDHFHCVLQSQASSGRGNDRRCKDPASVSSLPIDLVTSSKRGVRQGIDYSTDSTLPKVLLTFNSQVDPESISQRKQTGHRQRKEPNQTRNDCPVVGSPPTFYDNINVSSNAVGDRSRYDNTDSQGIFASQIRQPFLLRDMEFDPCNQHRGSNFTSAGVQFRTLYDNCDDYGERAGHHQGSVYTRNPVTDIEDLKTGFEHVHSEGASGNQIQHMREIDSHTRSCQEDSSPQMNVPPVLSHQIHNSGSSGNHSLYDNLSNPADHTQSSGAGASSNFARSTGKRGLLSSDGSSRVLGTVHREIDELPTCRHDEENHDLQQAPEASSNAEDELHYIDNYFDQYSPSSTRGAAPVLPSGTSVLEDGGRRSRGGSESTAEAKAADRGSGGQVSRSVDACADSSGKDACSIGTAASGGSIDGSPQQQNKNKPQSRLKKFFTSLLSLSSSDSDNENDGSSSSSSGW